MNGLKNCHPTVNLIYFIAVLGFSMFFMHPLCLLISLVSSLLWAYILKGGKDKKFILYMLPALFGAALMNPLFNHKGVTILSYFPSGNPLTLESVIYGLCAGGMLASVLCWFSCFNEVMTGDKLIYLFGRFSPSLSLIFSMTLRFVPRFAKQFGEVIRSQKGLGRDVSKGPLKTRLKNALSVMSVMITWALESSIDTADSMKARGYGLPKRSSFSMFRFHNRDGILIFVICALSVYIICGSLMGEMAFACFPKIIHSGYSLYGITVFAAYAILCILPVILEITEVIKWNSLKRKI